MIPNYSLVAKGLEQSKRRLPSLALPLACVLPLLLAACGGGGSSSGNGGQTGTPALTASVTTQGNFSSGQQNATYTIQVTNSGTGATSGTVTVVDPPLGFTVTAISGTNWTCTLATTTCTYGNSVAAGQTFPPITVTGNVTSANGTPVSIALSVSGGGTSAPVNSTPAVTVAAPILSIAKTHTGSFNVGQQGATYSVTVSNGGSAGATNAKVTVTETVPSGETLVSMSGSGWTCPGAGGANTCDRSDALATGASYPALTVTVNVSATATSPQVNQVSVSGGGMIGSASASDSTTISGAPDLSIVNSQAGTFTAGSNGIFDIAVSNAATAGPTVGTITVSDTLDPNFVFVSATATGWTCSAASQVVTCTNPGPLAPGASATTIPLVVAVSASASGTISNTAMVATPGDSNAANNSSTLSVTLTSPSACSSMGSESLLNGSYAFLLKGFDSSGNPALIGGVLTFNGTDNNGLITAGAVDMNLDSGVQLDLAVTSGSYGVSADQRGCMAITTSAGTQDYHFALGDISGGVASTGHVIGFDQGGPFVAGTMRKQMTSAFSSSQVTGNYAFGVSSPQNSVQCNHSNVCGGKFGVVGVLNFATGTVTGGEIDFNFNGELDATPTNTTWPASPISVSSGGSYSIAASTGRGTLVFALAVSGASPINTIIYVVSATDILVMSSDSQTNTMGNNIFAGEAMQQSGTPFAANPLSGTYVGYNSGLGSTGMGRADISLAGPLTLGSNALNFTQQRNDGGTFTMNLFSGTYSVSATGRMIYTPTTGSASVFYLVNTNQAFSLIGNAGVNSGFFESQSGSPFSTSSASGTYALGPIDPENLDGADSVGVATFTPATNGLSSIGDGNQSGGSPGVNHVQNLTYSVDSTGLGMSPSGCSISATSTTCQILFYVISPTKGAFIDINPNSTTPKLYLLDQ